MNTLDKIYELTYSPLLTPYNLLDNLKLDNYISINYSKIDSNIISEVTCLIDESEITFYYLFDENQFLLEIYYYDNNIKSFLFNRTDELEKHKTEFTNDDYSLCI